MVEEMKRERARRVVRREDGLTIGVEVGRATWRLMRTEVIVVVVNRP